MDLDLSPSENVSVWFRLVLRTGRMKGNQTTHHMMRVKDKSSDCLSVMRSQSGFKGWSHFRFKRSGRLGTVYLHNGSVVSVYLFYLCCENFTVFEMFDFSIVYMWVSEICLFEKSLHTVFILNAVSDSSKTGVWITAQTPNPITELTIWVTLWYLTTGLIGLVLLNLLKAP